MQEMIRQIEKAQRPDDLNPYDGVASGLTEYWYPVARSKSLGKKAVAIQVLDQKIALIRDQGKVYALYDRCPHRGVPLSLGRSEFPGTWACPYHGWVFDLKSGVIKAALTDGPDSPICGKGRVKTYPVEERLGYVWVFVGEGTPPPLDDDIPEELRDPEAVRLDRLTLQKGNWRYACENAFDEGHFKYLHRYGVLFSAFTRFPAWSKINVISEERGWITRDVQTVSYEDEYKDLGRWPQKPSSKPKGGGFRVSMRLPCIMRNHHVGTPRTNFSWYVPAGNDAYWYLQIYTMKGNGWEGLKFRLYFWTYLRWVHFVQFNKQDLDMVERMPETTPSRAYRPDVAIFAWRRLCQTARQFAKSNRQQTDYKPASTTT